MSNKDHEYAIVAVVAPINDRRYSSAEEAKTDALARARETGHDYTVIKVVGTALCHKTAAWEPA